MSSDKPQNKPDKHKTLHLHQYSAENQDPDCDKEMDLDEGGVEDTDNQQEPMLGRYAIIDSLGMGGMAEIKLVRDDRLGRQLAAKILHEKMGVDPELMHKFLLEAQITGQLEHPNIVPVHDLNLTTDGRLYFTMKRVWGEDLDQVLRRIKRGSSTDSRQSMREGEQGESTSARPWTLSMLLEVFMKCCDAIDFAHSRNVIHRDLKPSNIMVGRFGEVQLMDWGLAKVLGTRDPSHSQILLSTAVVAAELTGDELEVFSDPHATQVGTVVGTPAYMPPEQAAGSQLDERADIYSLGAILYEILTLQPPYQAKDPYALLEALRSGPPVRPSERAPGRQIPWELEAVIQKAMAREPAKRYDHAAELKSDIQAYLDGHILQAAQYLPWQRLQKWLRRHRTASIAVIAVLMINMGLYWGIHHQADLQLQTVAERAERQFLRDLSMLQDRSKEQMAVVQRLSGPNARRMIEPNGELAREVISEWYRAHSDAMDTLEQLTALASRDPSATDRARIDRADIARRRRKLARTAWLRAAQLGDVTLARLWIRRAVAAGLSREEELEARDQVERLYGLRASDIRIKAGQVLSNARKLQRASSDWYEWSMAQLLRSRGPDLVRMLLEPEHLDSRYEWERRLTIDALGRLGDTRTRGPQGADPVEALSQRLASVSLKWEIELAVLISQALGFLKDARAHRVLSQRRNTAGPNSVFWKRTAAAFARIPLPDSYFGSGRQAPRNASGYLARGQLQAARADFHGAVADYSKALERQPRSALALQLRALAHMALGQYDQALRDYNNADQLEPDNPTLLVNRGNTRQELHDLDGAIKDYTQAIKAQPRLGIAYYRRGLAWRMKKQHTKAVADYRRAMSEDSGLAASVYNSLGTVRLDLDNPKGAIEQFNLCLQIDPKNVQAFTNRGAARHALGDYYGAIQDYNLALRYNPVHAVAYKLRGDAYLARKAHRSALDDYDRALELTPNLEEAYIHRGIALTRLKQYDRAIRDLRHAAVKQPRQWKAWFGLAAALEGKGERKAARTALHKARRWAPESQHGQIQRALEKIED